MRYILFALLSISTLFAIEQHHITIDKLQRDYYIHFPKHSQKNRPLPLLFFMHGGGQNVKKMARSSLLNALADQKHFIVVYPVGVNKHWKDGRRKTYAGESQKNVDDVKFIDTLIEELSNTYAINKKKVYITGVSNGGLMTLRLGCDLSQKLSAIAPVIANMPKKYIGQCKPKMPLSLLLMNGTKDPIVPYYGGQMRFFKKHMGEVVSTQETINFWVQHNHCNRHSYTTNLPDLNQRDKCTVLTTTYRRCKDNSTVVLYSIQGGGHTMPEKKGFNMPKLFGEKNRDIEGIEVIVDFLLKH